jgi:hypothetical protein
LLSTWRSQKGALYLARKRQRDEIICGIEIVLTSLVNNPEMLILGGTGIGKNLINFPYL